MSGLHMQQDEIMIVPEFQSVCNKLIRKLAISGKNKSCVQKYFRQISNIVIHFKC